MAVTKEAGMDLDRKAQHEQDREESDGEQAIAQPRPLRQPVRGVAHACRDPAVEHERDRRGEDGEAQREDRVAFVPMPMPASAAIASTA